MSRAKSSTAAFPPRLEALEDRTLMSTCTVNRLGDVGRGDDLQGDLRYCVNFANFHSGGDTVRFSVTGTIRLKTPLPTLKSSIQIEGPGADLLTVRRDAETEFSVFHVVGFGVTISGLTISNGLAFAHLPYEPAGGGGIHNRGTLVIADCAVTENASGTIFSGDAKGGGIYNGGTLTIVNSTVSRNSVHSWDYLGVGGGIYNGSKLTLINSTVSHNTAGSLSGSGYGAGVYNALNRTLKIYHTTIVRNGGDEFGGALGGGIFDLGQLHMHNSIVASNNRSKFSGSDLYGSLTTSRYNLIGSARGGSGYSRDTDLLDVDPLLGPLADNGGTTLTHALLPGSPAIDAGDPNPADPPEWDQRGPGFPRIVNGRIDIGALEVQPTGMPEARRLVEFDSVSPSPVHGAFRAAVFGPALTPGAGASRNDPAPFTGLLGAELEPCLLSTAQVASSRTLVNQGHDSRSAPDAFGPVGVEINLTAFVMEEAL
jgi:hypothetical protein